MTATAWCSISNLVWGLSLFKCSWTILPSSLNASLMSRTRRRSRALLAIRRSRSLSIFCSGDRSSSSLLLWLPMIRTSRNMEECETRGGWGCGGGCDSPGYFSILWLIFKQTCSRCWMLLTSTECTLENNKDLCSGTDMLCCSLGI